MTRFKLTALGLVTALTLSACAGAVPTLPQIMAQNNWKGQDATAAVAKFGQPESVTRDTAGRTVYNWYDRWTRDVDVPMGNFIDRGTVYMPYETRREEFTCHVKAVIDNGRIEDMAFNYNRVGGCSAFGI